MGVVATLSALGRCQVWRNYFNSVTQTTLVDIFDQFWTGSRNMQDAAILDFSDGPTKKNITFEK